MANNILKNPDAITDLDTFSKRNKAISKFLKNLISPKPDDKKLTDNFVVKSLAVYGDWGKGKTSVIKHIYKHFESTPDSDESDRYIIPVWFEAWRFQHENTLYPALLRTIGDELSKQFDSKLKKYGKEIVKTGFKILKAIASGVTIKDPTGVISISGKDVLKSIETSETDISNESIIDKLRNESSPYYSAWHLLKRIPVEIKINNKPVHIVLFIDDLDRCMPEIAFNLLEEMKIWLDISGYTTIFALSEEEIILVVKKYLNEQLYHNSSDATVIKEIERLAKNYLLKILPLSIYMDEKEYKKIIKEKFKDIKKVQYDDQLNLQSIDDNFDKYVETNPYRKVQHLYNTLVLEDKLKGNSEGGN